MIQKICIVGLGYVGLPLAHAFAKAKIEVSGFDVNAERIAELKNGKDRTNELSEKQLAEVSIDYSDDPKTIEDATVVILAIPTPVDDEKRPDLSLLRQATQTVAEHMQPGAIVVYESTVYPGVTQEICGGDLKQYGNGKDFKLGYSPERVNPGDKEHTINNLVKIVAGEDEKTTEALVKLYGKIAPVHQVTSIKVAEMAKAIENAQRDLNIAYVNEVAKLCNKLDISTKEVLEAAETKWNFLKFKPGLVGGHCIGVDPYYLIALGRDKHQLVELIEAARNTNDAMATYVADWVVNKLTYPNKSAVLILGKTFKEDVPDDRNAKSAEVAIKLVKKGCTVTAHDPYLTKGELKGSYDAIVLLVPHREYLEMSAVDFAKLAKEQCLFYDLKSVFKREDIEAAGMTYAAL